jgi:uncharacterized membrane protein YgcG
MNIMQNARGRTAVRMTLVTLLFAAFAMALVQPVQGGTQAAPEIQDPAGDQSLFGQQSADAAGFTAADVITAWVDTETATTLNLNILTSGDITGGNANGQATTHYHFTFHLTVGGTEYTPGADVQWQAAATPDAGTAAAVVNGPLLILTVNKADIGNPAAGTALTNLFVDSASNLPPVPMDLVTDRAPDDGAGQDYQLGGSGGGGNPNDADGDGMNDTCEIKYFGNTTAQNASGDPDGDGLTNGQECALGTDPTKADTDGDGTNDKDDPFPLDPSKGGSSNSTSSSSSSSSSHSSSSSSSSSSSASHSATGGSSTGGRTKGAPKDLNEAMDRLTSDPGYLGLSSGGFLAVLVLCIIGLAVRWSL